MTIRHRTKEEKESLARIWKKYFENQPKSRKRQ
jgi:hypothetical protein